jgi:hypothetical protein
MKNPRTRRGIEQWKELTSEEKQRREVCYVQIYPILSKYASPLYYLQ